MTTDKVPEFSDHDWLKNIEILKARGLYSLVETVAERLNILAREVSDLAVSDTGGKIYSWADSQLSTLESKTTGITDGANQNAALKPLRVLVATSGGADSVSLLILCALAASFSNSGIEIVCAHINHRMRSQDSEGDALFCAHLAQNLKVSFKQIVATENQMENFLAGGSEESLRDFRYHALESIAGDVDANLIVFAHTLNDQIETYLFRSFRGSSPGGLRGIPCVRRHNKVLIARPLIDITRDQLLEFLTTLGFPWREDVSNQNSKYTRNYIRNEIAPRIFSRFEDFTKSIERTRRMIAEDESLLQSLCVRILPTIESQNKDLWQLSVLNEHPVSLRRRLFADALRSREIEVSFERVEKLLQMTAPSNGTGGEPVQKQSLSLSENWDVICEGDRLLFLDKTAGARVSDARAGEKMSMQPIMVKTPGITIIASLNKCLFVQVADSSASGLKRYPAAEAMEAFVSLEKVDGPLVFRGRQPGDFIQPFGMKEQVKLKKYLHTHKVVLEDDPFGLEKRVISLLACEDEVLWIPGVGLSEKLRAEGKPSHVLKLLDIGIDQSGFA
ncbi:MAG: tRNA lysidine(34) synthetase TilS [Leptolyngbya sp.]|nr:tRNA lysidine(34) synthetase TilS [Candidatus Melainabacteria bacterium]